MSRFLARVYVRTGPPEVVQEALADLKKMTNIRYEYDEEHCLDLSFSTSCSPSALVRLA